LKGGLCLTWLEKQCQIANVSMTGDLFYGGVPDVLNQEACDASMLALGKRGEGYIRDTHTLGSNFRAIINRVRKPILVGGEKERPLKKILFIEKSRRDISKTLALVASLQKSIHGGLIGLDIQKNNIAMQADLSEIMNEFHEIGVTDYRLVGHPGWSIADIAATARKFSADLIVMRKDRSPAMIKWLTGSTLGDLIKALPLPILLIQEYGLIHKIDFELERDKYVVNS
jgi:nucleotide-binding universal stress UspA family protein